MGLLKQDLKNSLVSLMLHQTSLSSFLEIVTKWWRWSCGWGDITSLNCSHQRAYCSSWYMSMQNKGGVISTMEYLRFVHQSSLTILPASSRKSGGTDEGNDKFCLTKYLFHAWKCFLTCLKISRHGSTALLPSRRKACCGFLLRLKLHLLSWNVVRYLTDETA
jgi:hypothetical protein